MDDTHLLDESRLAGFAAAQQKDAVLTLAPFLIGSKLYTREDVYFLRPYMMLDLPFSMASLICFRSRFLRSACTSSGDLKHEVHIIAVNYTISGTK